MSTELQKNLINPVSSFDIDIEWLKTLFKVDNIHSGQSLDNFKSKGGTNGFLQLFATNKENGINYRDKNEVSRRRKHFGENVMVEPPQTTIMEYIKVALDDFTLKILMVAAVCALIINISTEGWAHGWYEGTAILIAIVIITAITVVNDYLQDAQFRKLYKKSQKKIVKVVRNGKLQEIDATELLAGDIAEVETGLIFPADMILLSKNDNFVCDESQMTGEPKNIHKNIEESCGDGESPFLISGTKVMDGSGFALVTAVGRNCTIGILRASLETEPEVTPLQLKLEDLANTIGILGGGGAVLTFIGCCLGLVITCMGSEQELFSIESAKEVLAYVILAITIIVMAVPEGLPMAVIIALAYSVNEMKKMNNLVRDLSACETMGNATDICSDKTGTLTQNDMTVIDVYVSGTLTNVEKNVPEKLLRDENCKEMSIDVAINCSATPDLSKPKKSQTGNKTEMALLYFSQKLKIKYTDYRPSPKILKVKPFSSDRKKMTTLYQEDDGKRYLLVKGAPDIIVKNCSRYRSNNGTKQIDDEWTADLVKNVLEVIGNKRARAIGVCKVEVPEEFDVETSNFDDFEKNMEFLGVYGIMDPVRLDVPKAVLTCRKAQITVRMVTGDNTLIATAIAKKCHILPKDYNEDSDDYTVMSGAEFREATGGLGWRTEEINGKEVEVPYVKNKTTFTKIASKLRVLGRSLPEDKLLLVTGLQELDRVVAVTGDGTNDAPALKKSNVGFSMGLTGTDVCKDASSIVLIDDNFTSIITAIKYGRNVFDAIRKFVQFQLTVNFVAMAVAIICGFIIKESPLNAIEMLWLNMIMDSFAALALATEPPAEELLNRAPTKKKEKIITESMWRTVMVNVTFQLITLFVVLYYGHEWIGAPSSIGYTHKWTYERGIHYTFFFDCFVFLQMFNFINARSLKREQLNPFKNMCNNMLFWVIFFITLFGQFAFVQLIGRPVKCTPLPFWMHQMALGIGALSLVFGFIGKLIPAFPIPNFLKEKDEVDEEAVNNGMVSAMRSSFRNRNRSMIIN